MFRKVIFMFAALAMLVSASLATVYADDPPPGGPNQAVFDITITDVTTRASVGAEAPRELLRDVGDNPRGFVGTD